VNEDVEVEKLKAIQHWMARTVIPLLYDDPSRQLDSYGSGALIGSNENVLFATARHNLFFPDHTTLRDRTRLAIPIPDSDAPAKTDIVNTLGTFDVLQSVDPPGQDIDIALLHLKDLDLIARLRRSWNVIDRSKAVVASPQGNFVLSGYPSARVKITEQGLGGSLNTIHTERMPQAPQNAKQPIHPDYDLFFYYDDDATDLDGNAVKTPAVPGMSGSVVWELRDVEHGVWAPDNALTMVAIQVSWMKDNFARAKSWAYVEHILTTSGL
jgi:hypothetical protein